MSDRAEERHTAVSLGGFADLNAALAWVVNTHDREFTDMSMVKIQIESVLITDDLPGTPWREEWAATISGMTERSAQ